MSPRRTARTAFCLLLLTAAAPLAAGVNRWTRIGPYGGVVTVLAAAPSQPGLVYAVLAPGGVFRSTDAGRSWSLAGTGLVDTPVLALAVHPRRPALAYAGTFGGLLRTTNGGATWAPVGGEPGAQPVFVLAVNPKQPQVLWAALQGGRLLKSEDAGATWVGGEGWPDQVLSLALDPVRPQNVYVASYDRGVFRSRDGGASWRRLEDGLPAGFRPGYVAVDPRRPARVFLAGAGSGAGLFRSDDGGASWTRSRGLGLAIVGTILFDRSGTLVYAATMFEGTERIWTSDDGGLFWRPLFTLPKGASAAPRPLLAAGSGLLAGTGGHGVLASSDRGTSWRASNEGLSALYLTGLAVADQSPPRLYASDVPAGLFKSADRGAHWLRLDTDLALPAFRFTGEVVVDPHDPQVVYALFFRGFARSDNGGRRWQPFDMSCFRPNSLVLDPVTPGTLYLGGNVSIACSRLPGACTSIKVTPAGATCLRHPPVAASGIEVVAVDPHAPARLVAKAEGGLYHSLDGGSSWALLAGGVFPLRLVFDPRQAGVVYGAFQGAVGRSADGGATWELAGAGLPAAAFVVSLALDPQEPLALYAAAGRAGVFRSADGGRTWSEVAPGLEGLDAFVVRVDPEDPSILYAVTRGASVLSVDQEPQP